MQYRRWVMGWTLLTLAGMMELSAPPALAQGPGQGVIEGTVWRETVRRDFLQEPGELGVAGLTVELWSTTSISGRPLRNQATLTDSQGRFRFVVNALNGPFPDFGCFEVRLVLLTGIRSALVSRSQPICKVAAGGTAQMDFALPGGATGMLPFPTTQPPVSTNHAPSVIYLRADPAGGPVGGTIRLQALGLDIDDQRLTYTWHATGGAFGNPEGDLIDWTAPNQPGDYLIFARATDPAGASVQGQIRVTVTRAPGAFNHPPLVETVSASSLTPVPGQFARLSLQASDPDNDRLGNLFYFLGGARGARTGPAEVQWLAPARPGIYSVWAVVNDGRGGFGWAKRELSVNSALALNRLAPSYGRAGQVLIDSHGYLLWVGINDPSVAAQARELAAAGAQQWVLGRIVPDSGQRHGFYLDPSTVSLAEVTAEGIQTTVEQVSRRPSFYTQTSGGGFDIWAISGRLIQFVPAP
jgi:hypothetical protein